MDDEWLAERFETDRTRLQAAAYRMLGSASEADDAVQEAWLRLSRADPSDVENLGGWLTTVVARVCLDMLRSRRSRREEPLAPEGGIIPDGADPEREAVLAESVGLAMLAVLQRLAPAERVAFVLHDIFGVSFEEIAGIVGRSPVAARQLASRGRRRVRGASEEAARRTWRDSGRSWRHSSGPRAAATFRRCWRCSILMWCCAATRRRCGWAGGPVGSRRRSARGTSGGRAVRWWGTGRAAGVDRWRAGCGVGPPRYAARGVRVHDPERQGGGDRAGGDTERLSRLTIEMLP